MANEKNHNMLRNVLALSIAVVITGSGAGAALAQEQQKTGSIEEVSITGSRIRATSGFETPTPVTSISTSELKKGVQSGSELGGGDRVFVVTSALCAVFSSSVTLPPRACCICGRGVSSSPWRVRAAPSLCRARVLCVLSPRLVLRAGGIIAVHLALCR